MSDCHEEAMKLADAADAARKAGDMERAKRLFGAASHMAQVAAVASATQPSRAILFRSAAWLALEAGDPAQAMHLAGAGMAGAGVPEREHRGLMLVAREAAAQLKQGWQDGQG